MIASLCNMRPLAWASPGDILQASDDLSKVIDSYKMIVEGQPINGDSEEPRPAADHGETGENVFIIHQVSASFI